MRSAMNRLGIALGAIAFTLAEIVLFTGFLLVRGVTSIVFGVVRLVLALRRPVAAPVRAPRLAAARSMA